MLFCPSCANILLVKNDKGEGNYFACNSCPYIYPISTKLSDRHALKRKEVDDVLGGAAAWENVDSTEAVCPKCEHNKAYFMQIQIRSADEPMTTFYKCCECGTQWREN